MKKRSRKIELNYLARVEGEGALYVEIDGDSVKEVKLKIFEPPRFFEALLRGRDFTEAPDITARICGICPIAYQMSSTHAMEDALGVAVEGELAALRRLIYCGEWIESHLLHIYMLHAPDFLGYHSAIEMAKSHKEEVTRGLRMKKAGNSIVSLLGGREIHPINVKVGGFYKLPEKRELLALKDELKWGVDAAIETIEWVASFDFPPFAIDHELVSLHHPTEYPMNRGKIISNKGVDSSAAAFEKTIEELQVDYSTALQAKIVNRGSYVTGPMARYTLNYDTLPILVKEVAESVGMERECKNPYKSIVVRSLEVLFAYSEALALIDMYEKPKCASLPLNAAAGRGCAATEAPRGLLYHRYDIDNEGTILHATIIPPTSQTQKAIEEDLCSFLQANLEKSDEEITASCEEIIRNYDPCISCSAHFLQMKWKGREAAP